MYELGYDCINMNDGDLYIVPGAGYYYDYLNQSHIYGTWQPNKIGNFTIPVGSEQMLGSTFGVWNDKTGPSNDNGTSDVEVFDRIFAITRYRRLLDQRHQRNDRNVGICAEFQPDL